jgi:hypothetical protein
MVAEFILNALATMVAVVIMYIHAKAAFEEPVPWWLLMFVRMGKYGRNHKKPAVISDDNKSKKSLAHKTIVHFERTTVVFVLNFNLILFKNMTFEFAG